MTTVLNEATSETYCGILLASHSMSHPEPVLYIKTDDRGAISLHDIFDRHIKSVVEITIVSYDIAEK